MNQLKIGLIQMLSYKDKEASVKKAIKNIEHLANLGAKMIVLPEMFNCPYETTKFSYYAELEGGETWQLLSDVAKNNKIYLIGGTIPEIDPNEAGKIYNTTFIFDPEGQQIGKHRKIHLLDIDIENGQYFKESESLSSGDQITVVDTIYGKIGVAVCYDIRFPELARLMIDQGARIIIYPASFNMTTGPAHWELLFRTRAIDNQVFTVGCAPARDYGKSYISYGNSIVVDPWGDIVGRLDDAEGYLLGDIDLDEVERIRDQLPLLTHRRDDVYKVIKADLLR